VIKIFIKTIGNNHYWYENKRIGRRVVTLYKGRATQQEAEEWIKRKAGK
jgi:hypothetical protein